MLMKKGCAHERALCTAAADATGQSACAEDLLWVAAQAITITIATATTFVAIATASTHHPHCFCRSTTIATSVAATAAAAAATATTSRAITIISAHHCRRHHCAPPMSMSMSKFPMNNMWDKESAKAKAFMTDFHVTHQHNKSRQAQSFTIHKAHRATRSTDLATALEGDVTPSTQLTRLLALAQQPLHAKGLSRRM